MTVSGPSGRTYSIDNAAGTPTVYTTLIVGEPAGIGKVEALLSDVTGPADVANKLLPAGFYDGGEFTVTFQADVGGTPDPTADFHADMSGSRSFAVTFVTGWTAAFEAYIKTADPKLAPKEVNLLAVTFAVTGVVTIT